MEWSPKLSKYITPIHNPTQKLKSQYFDKQLFRILAVFRNNHEINKNVWSVPNWFSFSLATFVISNGAMIWN